MKFTIKKKYLLQAIQKVTNAISSRTVIPILAGMKIDVNENKIILTGSNSDVTIQSHINRQIDEEEVFSDVTAGSIVLPVPHFPEIVRKLPKETVHITIEDNFKTIIQSGQAVFTLFGQNSDEYPLIQIDQGDSQLPIET